MDRVRVTRADARFRVHRHRELRPLFEDWSVRRLRRLVDEPSRGVTHLVQQSRFKLFYGVQNLRAEFDTSTIRRLAGLRRALVMRQTRSREQLVVPSDGEVPRESTIEDTFVEFFK